MDFANDSWDQEDSIKECREFICSKFLNCSKYKCFVKSIFTVAIDSKTFKQSLFEYSHFIVQQRLYLYNTSDSLRI
jgi:hypothetical protein